MSQVDSETQKGTYCLQYVVIVVQQIEQLQRSVDGRCNDNERRYAQYYDKMSAHRQTREFGNIGELVSVRFGGIAQLGSGSISASGNGGSGMNLVQSILAGQGK